MIQNIMLVIGLVSLIVAIILLLYTRKMVFRPRLEISNGQVKPSREPMGYLRVTDGEKTSDLKLEIFGFVVDLSPVWDDVSEASRPLQVSFFVENRGKATAKAVKMLIPSEGHGFTVSLEGAGQAEFSPSEPLRIAPFGRLQCKDLGDIRPGFKHPARLVFKFCPLRELQDLLKDYDRPARLHDYYLSADNLECQSKLMWINLELPANE